MDVLPREAHSIERAGREVLDQHVARLDQAVDDFLALRVLGVDRDGALVVVEHREVEAVTVVTGADHLRVEAVDFGDVAQLAASDVAFARALDLDHVGAEPREKLRASRTRLHVREIQDTDAVQCLAHYVPLLRCVVRLVL